MSLVEVDTVPDPRRVAIRTLRRNGQNNDEAAAPNVEEVAALVILVVEFGGLGRMVFRKTRCNKECVLALVLVVLEYDGSNERYHWGVQVPVVVGFGWTIRFGRGKGALLRTH